MALIKQLLGKLQTKNELIILGIEDLQDLSLG